MKNVVPLFQQNVGLNIDARELLTALANSDMPYTEAVVILIDNRAGNWVTSVHSSGMSNSDVVLATRLIERQMLDAMTFSGG